jgi:hypothetical protein
MVALTPQEEGTEFEFEFKCDAKEQGPAGIPSLCCGGDVEKRWQSVDGGEILVVVVVVASFTAPSSVETPRGGIECHQSPLLDALPLLLLLLACPSPPPLSLDPLMPLLLLPLPFVGRLAALSG